MELSQMKDRIIILKNIDIINENGFITHRYEEIKEVWTKVEQIKITEKISANKEDMKDIKRFIIRDYKEITNIDSKYLYIKYEGKIFDVKGYESFINDENFISLIAEVTNGNKSNK